MQKNDGICTWHPWSILNSKDNSCKYAVIILNRPIESELNSSCILNIWEKAKVRITVDGGADMWLSWLKANLIEPDSVSPPELLTGDMDSISKKALQYYKSNGKTNVIVTEDQDKTDFTKALIELQRYLLINNLKLDDVIAFGTSSGRFDQTLSNINTLYYADSILKNVKIYLFGLDSLTWLLSEGSHVIYIPSNLRKNQEWCALIPVGAPCLVTTAGLKWNLNKKILEFGALVSTSNTYSGEPEVYVHTDSFLVWSMGIEAFCKNCS